MDIIIMFLAYIIVAFLLYGVTADANNYNIELNKKMKTMFFLFAPIFIIWYLIKRKKIAKAVKYFLIKDSQETEPLELSQIIEMAKNKQITQEDHIKTNISSEIKSIITIPQLRPFFNLPKLRHWFVILFILLCLIYNLLLIIDFSFYPYEISNDYTMNYSPLKIFFICMRIATFLGFCLLIDWRKMGFWIIIVAQSIICAFYFVIEPGTELFQIILYPFLLFGILNVRKGGVSTWEQLR